MARYNHVCLHGYYTITSCYPVCHRPSPHKRRTIYKQNVSGKYGFILRNVNQHISPSVGGAYLDEFNALTTHL